MKKTIAFLFVFSFLLSACTGGATPTPIFVTPTATKDITANLGPILYTDPSQPIEVRVEDLLKRMTLDEKIGQMTQVEKDSIQPGDITKYFIGSILSGGGGSPSANTPQGWYEMVAGFQLEALETRLKIPLIYGVDAVHGHGNMANATIFPHNIGLGATNNPDLVEQIGRATAEEMLASGIPWNFSPVIAVVQDVRWGRTYEAFSENTAIVSSLGAAYIQGMQTIKAGDATSQGQTLFTLATPKHFIGDGATIWGSSRQNIMNHPYMLDQGNMQVPESVLRELFLPPYQRAVDSGALSVMGSFSSWKGAKLHAQPYLLTNVLKRELGFNGFIISDWQAIDQIYPDDYYRSVVTAINAGVDMNMVPYDYITFIETLKDAVDNGDIAEARIDDAVRRILRVKLSLGLFEHPMPDPTLQAIIRSAEHLALARQAVRESLVLLKNDGNTLPLKKDTPVIFVAGEGANDIGLQSGGWTLEWQGKTGNDNEGTTILSGIRAAVSASTRIEFDANGNFSDYTDSNGNALNADIGIVVLAEEPYAEGVGDAADISLRGAEVRLLAEVRKVSKAVVVILLTGRPRVITEQLPQAEAWLVAWLPGTEGAGIADVLFGDFPVTGKLPFTWPRSLAQLPININNTQGKTGCDAPLFPFGFGLTFGDESPTIEDCN
jgi:beta-glucosidase